MKTFRFKSKIAALIAGAMLALLCLEAGLRAYGWASRHRQFQRNMKAAASHGAYRVMCLGESTTMGQYPQFLEQELNAAGRRVKFAVIDRGVIATDTEAILRDLDANLEAYAPDMVVTMMGVNDFYRISSAPGHFWYRNFRAARLLKWLPELRLLPRSEQRAWLPFGLRYFAFLLQSAACAQEQSPDVKCKVGNSPDYRCLRALEFSGRDAEAEAIYKGLAEGVGPRQEEACFALSELYARRGASEEVMGTLQSCIKRMPTRSLYLRASRAASALERHQDAVLLLNKALSAPSFSGKGPRELATVYWELSLVYRELRIKEKRQEYLEKTVEAAPGNLAWRYQLADFYYTVGKLPQAIVQFEKLAELMPKDDVRLASVLAALGELKKDRKLARRARSLQNRYSPITAENYRALKEKLFRRGIRLVAVQYPLRPVEQLKLSLDYDPQVTYVDNQDLFLDAVEKEGYRAYFIDRFAGDFGHCTEKGNRLLARNIAYAILATFP